MKIVNLSIVLVLFLSIFTACEKTGEEANPYQTKLIAHEWKLDGIYLGGSNTATQTADLSLLFKTGITALKTDNTLSINSKQALPTQWEINTAGTELTMKYPNVSDLMAATDLTSLLSAVTNSTELKLKVRVTDSEFVIIGDANEDINILGIINIPANAELRFNTTGNAQSGEAVSSLLTSSAWTGVGLFAYNTTSGTYPDQATTAFTKEVEFNINFLGIRTLKVAGIPVSTWTVDNPTSPTTISFFETEGGTSTREFKIAKLEAGALWLEASKTVTFLGLPFTNKGQIRFVKVK